MSFFQNLALFMFCFLKLRLSSVHWIEWLVSVYHINKKRKKKRKKKGITTLVFWSIVTHEKLVNKKKKSNGI